MQTANVYRLYNDETRKRTFNQFNWTAFVSINVPGAVKIHDRGI